MKYIVKVVYIICSLFFLMYLLLPNPDFPEKLPESIQSFEPADIETAFRRGYYTDFIREEVMNYYLQQIKYVTPFGKYMPTYSLNYPPEEAQVLIRDQARSTFLEELVHPFRESFFINGFEPKLDKDKIFVSDKSWRQKIIVRYAPSMAIFRVLAGLLIVSIIPIIYIEYKKVFTELLQVAKK